MAGAKNLIVALSDIHIGDGSPTCWYQAPVHERYLTAVLDWVVDNAGRVRELVLLGDVVEFWTYPFAKTPPTFAEIVAENPRIFGVGGALARVLDALDGNVTWLEGNHDMGITAADAASIVSPGGHHIRLHPEPTYAPLSPDRSIVMSHGHHHTLFNANDPTSPWDQLPAGHFVARAVAEMWSTKLQPGETVADIANQGAPSGISLGSLAHTIEKTMLGFERSLTEELFDLLAGTTGVDELAPIQMPDGTTATMAQARDAFKDLWSRWAEEHGGGDQGQIEAARSGWADAKEELGWHAQKDGFATGADLVVMGHTHAPVGGLENSMVTYVNTGFECPALPDIGHKELSFAVIDTNSPRDGEVWTVAERDGLVTCAPAVKTTRESITHFGTMDFSSYVELDNRANPEPLVLVSTSVERGRFVNPPPVRVAPHSVERVWIADDLGPFGSHATLRYRSGERIVRVEVACPTGFSANRCASTEPFTTRSGTGDWGKPGEVPAMGHPLFARIETGVRRAPAINLAQPAGKMEPKYDVVVVGSGYGGAIAASRFARAGKTVCLLERGSEHRVGEFPETLRDGIRSTQISTEGRHIGSETALFDFRLDDEMNVLIGCGLGGTSLINANVALRPVPEVFADDRWPEVFRNKGYAPLDAYYDRATEWLGSNAYSGQPPLRKYEALREIAVALGKPADRPPINVTFEEGRNLAGVHQPACNGCGNCVSGCNIGAKNTVAMNYLPDAVLHGAKIFTERSVRWVRRPNEGSDQWEVAFEAVGNNRKSFGAGTEFVLADVVVLAGGTLGSTEILLRSQREGLALSDRLGERFSGNGDVLGFAYDSNRETGGIGWKDAHDDDEVVGPCITGVVPLVLPGDTPGEGLVIEEGAVPGVLSKVFPVMLLVSAIVGSDASVLAKIRMVLRSWRKAARRTLTFLIMSDDADNGKLRLGNDRLVVDWPEAPTQLALRRDNELLNQVSPTIGAEYTPMPLYTKLAGYEQVSVHPLGGAVMGDDAETGVVNDRGEVFNGRSGTATHTGLHVLDGAIVPRPLGTNPSLTISALTERATELIAADRGWTIDLTPAEATRLDVNGVIAPAPVVKFTERMAGWFHLGAASYAEGVSRGKADASPLSFVVTIEIDDLSELQADPGSVQAFTGTVDAPALSPQPLTISDGAFRLMQQIPEETELWHMSYRMMLTTTDGRQFQFEGHKNIHTGPWWKGWGETTTLYSTISNLDGVPLGKGIVTISVPDLLRQLKSMDSTAPTWWKRTKDKLRFAKIFAGDFVPVYAGELSADRLVADPPLILRDVQLPEAQAAWFSPSTGWHDLEGEALERVALTATQLHASANPGPILDVVGDDAELMLTRFQGGDKGPVLVAAGFSMRANSFAEPTIEQTFTEALVAEGYDVWLFDYRASIALPSSLRDFTIDDIATADWPAAVEEVRLRTGAATVQVVGHCVGSVSILMALLAGLDGVRSVVCSQFSVHTRTSALNRFKNAIHVTDLFRAIGIKLLKPNTGTGISDRLIDLGGALLPIPKGEQCQEPMCRWLNAIFGLTHTHSQLNEATHQSFATAFGTGDLKPLGQLANMARKRKAVNFEGEDVYLPHVDRLGLPILFIQGSKNYIFKPKGIATTLKWLRKHHRSDLFELLYLEGYAHLDGFVGRNAPTEVFPHIITHLNNHQAAEPVLSIVDTPTPSSQPT